MATMTLRDHDTGEDRPCENEKAARNAVKGLGLRHWALFDTLGLNVANWLDPYGRDRFSMTPAKTKRPSMKPRACTTGRLTVRLVIPSARFHYYPGDLRQAEERHAKLFAEYSALGAQIELVEAL